MSEWTNEIIEACKKAGWWTQERSRGITGWYPSESMRAFKDGYEAGKMAQPEAVPTTAAPSVTYWLIELSAPEFTKAWERGKARADKEKAQWIK